MVTPLFPLTFCFLGPGMPPLDLHPWELTSLPHPCELNALNLASVAEAKNGSHLSAWGSLYLPEPNP